MQNSDNHIMICPKCGTKSVVEIVYGLPTRDLIAREKAGEIELGGCCIFVGESPKYHCKICEHNFGVYEEDDTEDNIDDDV